MSRQEVDPHLAARLQNLGAFDKPKGPVSEPPVSVSFDGKTVESFTDPKTGQNYYRVFDGSKTYQIDTKGAVWVMTPGVDPKPALPAEENTAKSLLAKAKSKGLGQSQSGASAAAA